MPRPRVAARAALRLAVLLALVAGTTAAGTTATGRPAETHLRYCGHGSHYDLRHPHFRMEFVSEFDRRGGRHYHCTHGQINPSGILPAGPVLDWAAPHGREELTG